MKESCSFFKNDACKEMKNEGEGERKRKGKRQSERKRGDKGKRLLDLCSFWAICIYRRVHDIANRNRSK
jgi:hypothetical protein